MRTPDAELSSSAYFGTRSISINGDLPGFIEPRIGIHRVVPRIRFYVLRSTFFCRRFRLCNQVKPAAEIIPPAIMLPIISAIFSSSLNSGYWLTLISCNKERLPCWTKLKRHFVAGFNFTHFRLRGDGKAHGHLRPVHSSNRIVMDGDFFAFQINTLYLASGTNNLWFVLRSWFHDDVR